MRFDIVTIFPEFFQVLDLSLMGKAKTAGVLQTQVHNLRDWAEGKHLSVDDTPYGGGAGMVMRADVWGRALETIFAEPVAINKPAKRILAVPTPSGMPLTQARAQELAMKADQIVFACGRYEGIDYRVIEHYRAQNDVEVWEYSLGDYVLNGGEVAALVALEAIARLTEGFMGNPESLAEESYSGDGLLEYPVYTKPQSWNNHAVPAVLMGGNHAEISRWRRDLSLIRTWQRRPDIIQAVPLTALDGVDLQVLAAQGYLVARGEKVRFVPGVVGDAECLSALAGELFPHACPDFLNADEISQFITEQLNPQVLGEELADPQVLVLFAEYCRSGKWERVGYTLSKLPTESEAVADIADYQCANANSAYISKCYVKPKYYGTGLAGAMLEISMAQSLEKLPTITDFVVGTNTYNQSARKFYRKQGFNRRGSRTFVVGGHECRDVVMVRDITAKPIRHWAKTMQE